MKTSKIYIVLYILISSTYCGNDQGDNQNHTSFYEEALSLEPVLNYVIEHKENDQTLARYHLLIEEDRSARLMVHNRKPESGELTIDINLDEEHWSNALSLRENFSVGDSISDGKYCRFYTKYNIDYSTNEFTSCQEITSWNNVPDTLVKHVFKHGAVRYMTLESIDSYHAP